MNVINILENNLEVHLRDTIEGMERYRHGIQPRKLPKHKRLKFKIAEGPLVGIIVIPVPSKDKKGIDNMPVLQVGLLNDLTGRYEYYEPEGIPKLKT